jgi:two-component system, NtrC family, nitrogen regulation response regulator GlnG
MKAIWIVDDDHSIRFVLEKALAREQLVVRSFSSAREALAALNAGDEPQVLVSDIRMPGGSGLDLLSQVKTRLPGLPVIVMTAYSDIDSAVSAFQGGAFEYLPKPFDVTKAVELIRRAMDESLREAVVEPSTTAMPEMLGQASAMQDVFRAIGRLSQSHVTVLITGESGSGKELVARALHKHSPRAGGPFVAINTAAIPKDLLESELFGHERGAFTGAQTMRRGRFEQADGGTLFLDEIGDMPFDLQTRLLRVLSDGQFYRVGGHQPLRAQVRVIAATHQNLEERVRLGAFREDLFHRLNVIRLRLPALRERSEDIPMLARHFLARSAQELGVEAKRLTDAAVQRLSEFEFPGNVRQLENVCHWVTVMAPSQVVEVKDLPPELLAGRVPSPPAVSRPADSLLSADSDGFAPSAPTADSTFVGDKPWTSTSPAAAALIEDSVALSAGSHSAAMPVSASAPIDAGLTWLEGMELELRQRLERGEDQVWDVLSAQFEGRMIQAALSVTKGRRIEAAQRLGIGRNTITRKIQELKLED